MVASVAAVAADFDSQGRQRTYIPEKRNPACRVETELQLHTSCGGPSHYVDYRFETMLCLRGPNCLSARPFYLSQMCVKTQPFRRMLGYGERFTRRRRSWKRGSERSGSDSGSTLMPAGGPPIERCS